MKRVKTASSRVLHLLNLKLYERSPRAFSFNTAACYMYPEHALWYATPTYISSCNFTLNIVLCSATTVFYFTGSCC